MSRFDPALEAPAGVQGPPPSNLPGQFLRAMRGRWIRASAWAGGLGLLCGYVGLLTGGEFFESQAIIRVYPQEANILYRTGDDSVLKTFDSFVKAETTYLASAPVMERAALQLAKRFSEHEMLTPEALGSSIEIKRNDSIIVLKTSSKSPQFAQAKLGEVIAAYLALKAETESKRSKIRLGELRLREAELASKEADLQETMLEIGGEFGLEALTKAHVEKVAQIDALSARRGEVEQTLASLRSHSGSTVDVSNTDILRATLLDRALADLNFERAKREAELATLETRYRADSQRIKDKRDEIEVLDQAMAQRREQIQVLGQTGALTEASASDPDQSIEGITRLLEKISGQLEAARRDARALNEKRSQLLELQESSLQIRKLLEETRKAIDVILLEADRSLPGYSVLMAPPSTPQTPVSDTRMVNMVAGAATGAFVAFAAALVRGLGSPLIGYSDALSAFGRQVRLIQTIEGNGSNTEEMDRLRNAIQLIEVRSTLPESTARILSVTRLASGSPHQLLAALGESFARAGMSTVLIDADFNHSGLSMHFSQHGRQGLGEMVSAGGLFIYPIPGSPNLSIVPIGSREGFTSGAVGLPALRRAITEIARQGEVLLISAGAMPENPAADLTLSLADLAVAEVRPTDPKRSLAGRVEQLDRLPAQGGVFVFTHALPNDPARTQ